MSLTKRKSIRKRQRNWEREARKSQRTKSSKSSKFRKRKKMTVEQRKARAQLLIDRKEEKEKRRTNDKKRNETAKIKRIRNGFLSIIDPAALDELAKKTGFIKKPGEITAIAYVYIISFGYYD